MRSLAVWVLPAYQRDVLFAVESPMNRDDCLAPFHALKRELEAKGWRCHTQDVFMTRNEVPTDVLFLDMPSENPKSTIGAWGATSRCHLLIQECEVVLPRNWDPARHEDFTTVFTWHPELIEKRSRYRETNFAQKLVQPGNGVAFDARKFCTLIAGNKGSSHPFELYSKRVEAIRYFEKHDPKSFDLYGVGWDKLEHSNLLFKVLNRFPTVAKALAPKFPSYRGKVANKRATLETYRFAICFENARDIPGYVTEKIFDCLMAGCVPVYWGSPDIASRIPDDCFIDFRKFDGFDDLSKFMKSYSSTQFHAFLEATRSFLATPAAQRYDASFFARSLTEGITSK
ncbi:MAG: glycosyltransferase family 10 [Bdellovibrionota bacterium]